MTPQVPIIDQLRELQRKCDAALRPEETLAQMAQRERERLAAAVLEDTPLDQLLARAAAATGRALVRVHTKERE
jgi:hypothetical protein